MSNRLASGDDSGNHPMISAPLRFGLSNPLDVAGGKVASKDANCQLDEELHRDSGRLIGQIGLKRVEHRDDGANDGEKYGDELQLILLAAWHLSKAAPSSGSGSGLA